jgi:hypothetical protein
MEIPHEQRAVTKERKWDFSTKNYIWFRVPIFGLSDPKPKIKKLVPLEK